MEEKKKRKQEEKKKKESASKKISEQKSKVPEPTKTKPNATRPCDLSSSSSGSSIASEENSTPALAWPGNAKQSPGHSDTWAGQQNPQQQQQPQQPPSTGRFPSRDLPPRFRQLEPRPSVRRAKDGLFEGQLPPAKCNGGSRLGDTSADLSSSSLAAQYESLRWDRSSQNGPSCARVAVTQSRLGWAAPFSKDSEAASAAVTTTTSPECATDASRGTESTSMASSANRNEGASLNQYNTSNGNSGGTKTNSNNNHGTSGNGAPGNWDFGARVDGKHDGGSRSWGNGGGGTPSPSANSAA